MGLFQFIARIFGSVPISPEEVLERRKKLTLRIMRSACPGGEQDETSFLRLQDIYRVFVSKETDVSLLVFIDIMHDLVAEGFVQRIDGGRKELPPMAVHYVISDLGINHIGYAA